MGAPWRLMVAHGDLMGTTWGHIGAPWVPHGDPMHGATLEPHGARGGLAMPHDGTSWGPMMASFRKNAISFWFSNDFAGKLENYHIF